MLKLYWGTTFAQSDIGGMWMWAKVRPWWYWECRRIWIFLGLIRADFEGKPLGFHLAWTVTTIIYKGLVGPCPIHRGKPNDEVTKLSMVRL